jgi:mono/diheme cytochrome c family protein
LRQPRRALESGSKPPPARLAAPERARFVLASVAALGASLALVACGSEKVSVPESDSTYKGAELFAQRCSGCHTLTPAGTMGSDARNVRAEGPTLDQRVESKTDVLFAIRNGGFTGSIMPQNIVTGRDANAVAAFVAKYAGRQSVSSPRPGQAAGGG